MLKKWIKEYQLKYEGILVTKEYCKKGTTIYENNAYKKHLWWSNKLKCHMFQIKTYWPFTLESVIILKAQLHKNKTNCYHIIDNEKLSFNL